MNSLPAIVVERAPATENGPSIRRSQRVVTGLLVLVFFAAIMLLPIFFYAFWVLFQAIVRAWHLQSGSSLLGHLLPGGLAALNGWPFDAAFVLSTLAAWSILYLSYDRLSMVGILETRAALRTKAEARLTGPLPPLDSFFVELRPAGFGKSLRNRWRPDIGWLVVRPDAVQFFGDAIVATVPREQIGAARRLGNRLGLAPTWVRIPLREHEELRVLVQDHAVRLSETQEGARRLIRALENIRDERSAAPQPEAA